MLLQNKTVAIVGGGPGGLSLARLLQNKGISVTVYERDTDQHARVQGSPLDLHAGSGLATLEEAGLMEEFRKNYMPGADRRKIMNPQAEVLYSDHMGKAAENFGEPGFRPEIDRGVLRRILLESLSPETIIWGSHFISMEPKDNGWTLYFKGGETAYADIVVAADGANSRIRPYVTTIRPFYTGVMMLEGVIYKPLKRAPRINELLAGGKIMAFGNGRNILMGQKGNGEIGFYASFKADADWAGKSGVNFTENTAVLNWFVQQYEGWSDIWQELFANASEPFIPRPIYCAPVGQEWQSKPNLALLGDAAHVMPPFAGEGVNMAMLDALELSRNLTSYKFSTLQEAISGYETAMRQRAALAAKESLDNGEIMHSDGSLKAVLAIFEGHSPK